MGNSAAFAASTPVVELADEVDVPFTRFPGSLGGHERFRFQRLRHCRVQLLDRTAAVKLSGNANCYILIGPCAGQVVVSDCSDCVVIAAAREVRVARCKQLKLFLHTTTPPRVDDSSEVLLAPWHVAYPTLARQCAAAGLRRANRWRDATGTSATECSIQPLVPQLDLPVTDALGNSLGPCDTILAPDWSELGPYCLPPLDAPPLPPAPDTTALPPSAAASPSAASVAEEWEGALLPLSPVSEAADAEPAEAASEDPIVEPVAEPGEDPIVEPVAIDAPSPRLSSLSSKSHVSLSEEPPSPLESPSLHPSTPSPMLYPTVVFTPIACPFYNAEPQATQAWTPPCQAAEFHSPSLAVIQSPRAIRVVQPTATDSIVGTRSCPRRREPHPTAPRTAVDSAPTARALLLEGSGSHPSPQTMQNAPAVAAGVSPDPAPSESSDSAGVAPSGSGSARDSASLAGSVDDGLGNQNSVCTRRVASPAAPATIVGNRSRPLRPRMPQPMNRCPELLAARASPSSRSSPAAESADADGYGVPNPRGELLAQFSEAAQPTRSAPTQPVPVSVQPPAPRSPSSSRTPRARQPPPTHAASQPPHAPRDAAAPVAKPPAPSPAPKKQEEKAAPLPEVGAVEAAPRPRTPGRVVRDIFNNEHVLSQSPPPQKPPVAASTASSEDTIQDFVTLHLMLEQLLKLLDARQFDEAKKFRRIVDECHLLVAPEAPPADAEAEAAMKARRRAGPFAQLPAEERQAIVREQTRLTSECISSFFLLLEEMDVACGRSPADAASYVNSLVEFAYEVKQSVLAQNDAILLRTVRS